MFNLRNHVIPCLLALAASTAFPTAALAKEDGGAGRVIITEIMYNSAGIYDGTNGGTSSEWVEIFNNGTAAVDVSGWRLDDEDTANWSALPAGSILLPGEAAVINSSPTEFKQTWGSGVKVFQSTWSNLANSPTAINEVLTLLDASDATIDIANYLVSTDGWPASGNGRSIYLRNGYFNNDIGSNWGQSNAGVDGAWSPATAVEPFYTTEHASPGFVIVPEPSTLSLLLLGFLGMSALRRR